MSDRTAVYLCLMILALAALVFMVQRQLSGELAIVHDRLTTFGMNGGVVVNPIPVEEEQ